MTRTVRAAVVQATPIPFDIDAGIADAVRHVEAAADSGARIVAFGETFLGGYPIWLDEAANAALWDHPGAKALHAALLRQAVFVGDPRLEALSDLAARTGAVINIGAHERVRSSLYNAQLTFAPGLAQPLIRRKLVPTHGERLIWARGDGSTLDVLTTDWGRLGGLICWEHWMPLARAAMHARGETVHVAQWPTVRETYLVASRHYAFEGRCFVLAAGTTLSRDDVLEGYARVGGGSAGEALLRTLPEGRLQHGGSAIIAPDADIIAGPAGDQSHLLVADLDHTLIGEALAALDTDGHYARPDIFELKVNIAPQPGIVFG